MRYLISFSYDGTKFHGFQRQNDVENVQSTLESALNKYFNQPIVIKGSGRTDAGVHAMHQCAHFDINGKVTKKDINNLNNILQNKIHIKDLKKVNDDFHARHSVRSKTYVYKINSGKCRKDLEGYFYQINKKLDYKNMKKASHIFVGTHNFKNFVSGKREDYTSTIYNIKIKKSNNFYIVTFKGIGFYRYMVRHLVGAILDVGKGKRTVDYLKNCLDNPDINCNLSVAPACGLYLKMIKY